MELDEILKKYKGFINPTTPETWFTFSLPSLNRLVGGKGLRGGRLVQFIGKESTGKTTLALDIVANAQKDGKKVAYIDFERTLDLTYARYLGVNTEDLLVVKTDTAEQGLDLSEQLVKAGIDLIIIDSIPTAVPASESERDLTDNEKMASAAGFITRWCKRMTPILDNHGALCIVINQWRANFSTLSRKESKPYGPNQLRHSSAITIELTRIKNGEDETIVQAMVEKNKLGGKERSKAEYTMGYGTGFDIAQDIILLALEAGIVEKRGAWFYYKDIKAQGMEQAKVLLPIDELRGVINVE